MEVIKTGKLVGYEDIAKIKNYSMSSVANFATKHKIKPVKRDGLKCLFELSQFNGLQFKNKVTKKRKTPTLQTIVVEEKNKSTFPMMFMKMSVSQLKEFMSEVADE